MRCMWGIVVLLLLVVFSASAVANEVIKTIEVQGNTLIPTEEILEVIEFEEGMSLDPDALRRDLQAVYDLGWFYDVSIDFRPEGDGLKAIFKVRENIPMEGLIFEGVEVFSYEELEDLLNLEINKPLNTIRLERGLQSIEETYHDQGYILARINDVYLTEEGYLEITINEGYLGQVHFEGNEKTRDYVIEREIALEEGDVFNVQKIHETLQNIYFLGYFSENIFTDLKMVDPQNNIADVYFKLEEVDTGNFFFGGGYNTQTGLFGSLRLEEKNLLGLGQEAGLEGELGMRSRSINVRFYEPHLLNSQFSFGTGFYWSRDREKDRDTGEYDFTHKKIGGNITLGHHFTDTFRITSRFRLDQTTISHDVDPSLESSGQTRSITLTGIHNTTDSPMNPRHGGRESLSYELAGFYLGGDYDFHKISTDLRRYFPGFHEDHSWAFRLMGGIGLGPDGLPSHEEFRVGGSETLRGYDHGAKRGDLMSLFNAEYRFKIYGIFDGVVFLDAGHAWNYEEGIVFGDIGLGTGAGIRLNTPLGQFRFDLGVARELEPPYVKPHFSIGHTF